MQPVDLAASADASPPTAQAPSDFDAEQEIDKLLNEAAVIGRRFSGGKPKEEQKKGAQ